MYIIARDGSGDFTSLKDALDAVPGGRRAPVIFVLRMDTYHEQVTVAGDNIRIVGEAGARTVLDGDGGCALKVTGRNVEVENLTVTSEGENAVCVEGDRCIFRGLSITGGKNALVSGEKNRLYVENTKIRAGMIPVSAGEGAWLDRCTLTVEEGNSAPEGDAKETGAVFHACCFETSFLPVHATLLSCQVKGKECSVLTDGDGLRPLTQEEISCVTIPERISGWDGWRPDRRVPTWFLCGDSTMADYPEDVSPMTGWGQKMQALMDENVYIENCAVPGRSSKSFVAEKRLNFIELCLRRGDRLVICFGHNDEKADRERSTHPRITYPEYLTMYVDAARRQGAEPILVTSIARRHFDASGQLLATHGDYPAAVRELAGHLGVRLVDMERGTMKLFQDAGVEGTKELFCHVAPGHPHYPEGLADNSHLHERGATRVAALFLRLLAGDRTGLMDTDIIRTEKGSLGSMMSQEDSNIQDIPNI